MTPAGGLQINVRPTAVLVAVLIGAIVVYLTFRGKSEVQVPVSTKERIPEIMSGEINGEITVSGSTVRYIFVKGKSSGRGGSSTTGRSVLLLHGMRFNLQNWMEINTVSSLASWGVDVAAVTLHAYSGYGDVNAKEANAAFLRDLVSQLGLTKPVIVSPSASGSLSLPYLLGVDGSSAATAGERASGFIAIAPVATQEYDASAYKQLKIPVCSVYGDRDPMAPTVQNALKNIDGLRVEPIAGAGHACYLDNPAAWHAILRKFLSETVGWSEVLQG